MIEAGRRFWQRIKGTIEQPINPHGTKASDAIDIFINSIYIKHEEESPPNITINWGIYRIGRETVYYVVERDNEGKKGEKLRPYFVYFFDMIDPENPYGRIGFKADKSLLQPYYTSWDGTYDLFVDNDTTDVQELTSKLDMVIEQIDHFRKHEEKI